MQRDADYIVGFLTVGVQDGPTDVEAVRIEYSEGINLEDVTWAEVRAGEDLIGAHSIDELDPEHPTWQRRSAGVNVRLEPDTHYSMMLQISARSSLDAHMENVVIAARDVETGQMHHLSVPVKITITENWPNCPEP